MVITVYGHEADGHIVTIMFHHASGGAVNETMTIPAGYPAMDLNKAHPIISGLHLIVENVEVKSTVAMTPALECSRGQVPDGAGEWNITGAMTFNFFSGIDKNAIHFLTYWAAGAQQF